MDTLYIFNPEHDLALANGSAYFCPPISAQRFATEAAALLIWIAENNDSVLCPPVNAEFEQYLRLFQKTSKLETHHSCALSHFDRIMPWGWDFKLVQILKQYQWAQDLYFSDSQLEIIKKLSHRQTACRTLDFLQTLYGNLIPLPHTSLITDQIDDIELFFKKEKDLIFKMPWSGSGKGLRWGRHTLTDKDKGWITNCIKQQGCVVVEKRYPVIQDFAMEFEIDESVHF